MKNTFLQLILLNVLNCLYDSIGNTIRKSVEKKNILEALDIVMLAFDEICDKGFVFYILKSGKLKICTNFLVIFH